MEWNKKPGVKTSPEEFNKRAEYFGFNILSIYKNNKTKVLAKCLECGFENMVRPDNILSGKRCKKCYLRINAENAKFTQEDFEKRVAKKVGNTYSVIGEYKGADIKIKIKHNDCGYEYLTTPNKFYHCGRRCPNCYNSNPEKEIKGYLDSMKISYEEQFKFKDCKNIQPLRFDFKININNDYFLLEYQGEQHFKPFRFTNGEEKFKETQRNDKIKYDYCHKNKISLHYIDYKQNIYNELIEILDYYVNPEPRV